MCVCVCVCERMCSLKNVFEQIFDVNIFNEIFCDIHIFKTFVYVSVCLSASLTVCLSVSYTSISCANILEEVRSILTPAHFARRSLRLGNLSGNLSTKK